MPSPTEPVAACSITPSGQTIGVSAVQLCVPESHTPLISTDFTKQRLLEVLTGGGAGLVPPDPDDPWLRVIRGGRVTAPLVGGCLWLLMQTLATPWEIELEGAILFFEDVHSPPYHPVGSGDAGARASTDGRDFPVG